VKGKAGVRVETKVPDWDVLMVGTDTLPPEGKEVLFQLGAELVPGVTSAEDDRLGNDNVGKDMKVPLDRLMVGTEPLPREVVSFQPENVLPFERTSELVSAKVVGSDRVGKGVSVLLVILTVGTETLLDDGGTVVFHPGPGLGLDDIVELVVIGFVGNGALGNGSPVPVILILGVVKLEIHPVEIDSVGRVPLPEGLDVVFTGIDHGSEPLVVLDRVISGSGVLVLGD